LIATAKNFFYCGSEHKIVTYQSAGPSVVIPSRATG